MEGSSLIIAENLHRAGTFSWDLMVTWKKVIQTLAGFQEWKVQLSRTQRKSS